MFLISLRALFTEFDFISLCHHLDSDEKVNISNSRLRIPGGNLLFSVVILVTIVVVAVVVVVVMVTSRGYQSPVSWSAGVPIFRDLSINSTSAIGEIPEIALCLTPDNRYFGSL